MHSLKAFIADRICIISDTRSEHVICFVQPIRKICFRISWTYSFAAVRRTRPKFLVCIA